MIYSKLFCGPFDYGLLGSQNSHTEKHRYKGKCPDKQKHPQGLKSAISCHQCVNLRAAVSGRVLINAIHLLFTTTTSSSDS